MGFVLASIPNTQEARDAILLASPRAATDRALLAALRPLIGAIDVKTMREANRLASTGTTPEAAARWIWERIER